tara:strand:+ start:622 stop:927 length:306 start_codon:yes stop_codon:yes gene_type:complete
MSEENKYNIKVNPRKPNKDDIRQKMDFEGAFKAYIHKAYRTPWSRFQRHSSKNRKVSMFVILTIVVSVLVFLESEENETLKKEVPKQENIEAIQIDSLKKN